MPQGITRKCEPEMIQGAEKWNPFRIHRFREVTYGKPQSSTQITLTLKYRNFKCVAVLLYCLELELK